MNIPNILSLIRLCVVPLVPLVYFSEMPNANIWAAVIYLAATLTDFLDGYIARKYDLVTRLGRVLDPLADKLMTFCVLVCIIIVNEGLLWAGVIFFAKESCMGLGALVQYRKIKDVLPSNIIGKLSTAFFFVVCFVILVYPGLHETVRTVAVATAIALNLLAFIIYVGRFIQNKEKQE